MFPIPRESNSPPAREAVVLLHSSGASARQWNLLADALRPTHDVHAIDLHGHGRRPPWTGARPFSLRDDQRLALEVLEQAGGGHVIGHSYGGAVAMHLAARRPGLVRSLAVYEPVLLHLLASLAPDSAGTREVHVVAARMRERVEAADGSGAAGRFVDYWSGPGSWRRMDPMRQGAIASRMATILAHFDTLSGEPLPPATWHRLEMPLLVLHGSRTTNAARTVARLLRWRLPRADHVMLPGLGHMGPLTHASRVNERLLAFLRVAPMPEPAAAADGSVVDAAARRQAHDSLTREAARGLAQTPRRQAQLADIIP